MVNESISMNFQAKTTRPKAIYLWTEADVQKWLRRHCSDYYHMYWESFHEVIFFIQLTKLQTSKSIKEFFKILRIIHNIECKNKLVNELFIEIYDLIVIHLISEEL